MELSTAMRWAEGGRQRSLLALALLALSAPPCGGARHARFSRVPRRAHVVARAPPAASSEAVEQAAEPCNVVLTHTSADFDSLAGSVALAKLWNAEGGDVPTVVVMPRGANPTVKRFLAYHKHLYPIRGFNTIRPSDVRKVGVVDTQSRERLGRASEWLETADSVVVFDHHVDLGESAVGPPAPGDIAGANAHVETVIEPVGSATTLLIERLRERDVKLRDAEATLFALGIRADTGSLTYEHTTVRDAKALVWLMEQGASQQAIAEFGQARLSHHQRSVLTDALAQAEVCTHHGIKMSTVVVDTNEFLTGMSRVAEEILELTTCDVSLLGVVHHGGGKQRSRYVSIIGRVAPRAITVDLNAVLQPYGGGGHPKAAAASVRLRTREADGAAPADHAVQADGSAPVDEEAVDEARELLAKVREAVEAQIPDEVRAESVMTTDVVCLEPEQTVDEAQTVLRQCRLRGAPVVDPTSGKLLGLLKLSDAVRAAQGGKGGAKIKGIVRSNVPTVTPQMTFLELENCIMDMGIGRLPVVSESGKLVGIITRTDILRHHNLYASLRDPSTSTESRVVERQQLHEAGAHADPAGEAGSPTQPDPPQAEPAAAS